MSAATARRAGVLCAVRDGIASMALLRPRVDLRVAQDLCAAAERIAFDPDVRVAVLEGPRNGFCLGVEDEREGWPDWVGAVAGLAVPVIAIVAGAAVGAGAELALAADLRIAGPRAAFAFPHLAAGALPRHGATQRLPRIVGRTRAMELLLTGRRVGAREAQRIGLVTQVSPQPATAARAVAAELCAKGPIALRLAKEAVRASGDLPLAAGVRLEQDLYVLLQTTADRAEGVRAFLRKRRPRFRGA
ncbi:enoyl-CoA hydratase/isomerase family protein [bacterium]|nr:enoyl-CoA hydratase/isomerase family protein [bacterium]